MKQSAKNISLFITLTALSCLAWYSTRDETSQKQRLLISYQTSSNRTTNVNDFCSAYSDRSSLVTLSDKSLAESYMSSVNSDIGIDGIGFMKSVSNAGYSQARTMVTDNLKGFAIFVASFGVGLVCILVIWPFLLCCCCCPDCCPPKCCRQSKKHKYSLWELYWPVGLLSLALTLAMGASVYGLIKTTEVGQSIKKMSCSAAIITDNILNGNVTMDQSSYFAGLYTISSELVNLQANISNIDGNLSRIRTGSSDPTMNNVLNKCQTALNDTKKISNNDAAGNNLNLKYSTPIDAISPSGGPIVSSFVTILGSFISQKGYVWTLYSSINDIYQVLTNLRNSAEIYHNENSNVTSGISQLKTKVNDITDSIKHADDIVSKYYTILSRTAAKGSNTGIIVYYAVVLGLSIFSLIGTILVTFCAKTVFRYIIYGACFFLFIAGLIGFLLSTLLSVIIPPYTWGCEYYAQSLTNSGYFYTNLHFLIDQKTLSQLSICMPFGNGNLLSTIGGNTTSGLQNLKQVISTLSSFNSIKYTTPMNNSIISTLNIVSSYSLSQIPDITDSSSLNILNSLSSPNNGSWTGCNSALSSDSWVPSVNQDSNYPTINCTALNGNSGNSSTCSSGVSSTSSGCNGCMDSGQVLNYYLNPTHILLTDLGTRYGAVCTFNDKLNNVWKNYYSVKETALGPTVGGIASSSGVLPRTKQVTTDLNDLFTQINIIPPLFSDILTSMSSINNLIDPNYGILAGLNCSLLGEDFTRLQYTTCGTLYKDTYLLRFALGILSYGILFSLCASVCVGVRHYKKRMQQEEKAYAEEVMYPGTPVTQGNLVAQGKFISIVQRN